MTTPYPTEDGPERDADTAGAASIQPDHAAHDDTAATASGVTGQSPESTEAEGEAAPEAETTPAPAPAPAPGEAVTEHIAVSAAQSPGSETAETIKLDGVAVTERLGASSTARIETRDVRETAEPGETGETGDIRESGETWETKETEEAGGTRETGDIRQVREKTRVEADGSGYRDHDRSGAPRAVEQTSAAPTVSYPPVPDQDATPAPAPAPAAATGSATAPSIASPVHDAPRRRGARMGTVVWGILLAAIGAGIVARGIGVDFDVELALIIVLSVMGGALLVGSVVAGIRRT
ncbi:hypothetical protein SANBI_002802 [Sanguibacter sp. 4.1]|uniref:Uncharacterized protein n=1 Tax=Sanguibacter biliveldensis TaxID=3030830 RepID=A0AAF0Z3U2_9MICO|nr:hypothetical protein [Sanguibacter sp. 4.1]WPF81504.1 hypothetical protein SANBI_002802 [Sanguibacter sp. 4.1]